MKPRYGIGTNRETGQRYVYVGKIAWNTRYFSCDDGLTWFRSLTEARRAAEQTGVLQLEGMVRICNENGQTLRFEPK